MKHFNFLTMMRFNRLAFDFIFLTIAILLLAQTNSVQPSFLQNTNSPLREHQSWRIPVNLAGAMPLELQEFLGAMGL